MFDTKQAGSATSSYASEKYFNTTFKTCSSQLRFDGKTTGHMDPLDFKAKLNRYSTTFRWSAEQTLTALYMSLEDPAITTVQLSGLLGGSRPASELLQAVQSCLAQAYHSNIQTSSELFSQLQTDKMSPGEPPINYKTRLDTIFRKLQDYHNIKLDEVIKMETFKQGLTPSLRHYILIQPQESSTLTELLEAATRKYKADMESSPSNGITRTSK